MRLTILLVIFKKNSTVGLAEVSRLINAAISKRQGDQGKNNSFEEKKLKVWLTILGYYALKG